MGQQLVTNELVKLIFFFIFYFYVLYLGMKTKLIPASTHLNQTQFNGFFPALTRFGFSPISKHGYGISNGDIGILSPNLYPNLSQI